MSSNHTLAMKVINEAINQRLRSRNLVDARRSDYQCSEYDRLSAEIGELRKTRDMIADSSITVPTALSGLFGQIVERLDGIERQLATPEVAEVKPSGPLTITITQRLDLTGFVRRTEAGILITDMASGVVVPVNTLHTAELRRPAGGTVQAVIFNFDRARSTVPTRLVTESSSYYRSPEIIVPGTLQEIPLPE